MSKGNLISTSNLVIDQLLIIIAVFLSLSPSIQRHLDVSKLKILDEDPPYLPKFALCCFGK
jgi:hypothetical protein